MHPAISVIFFTVTSGAGFGMMFVLGLGLPVHQGAWTTILSCGLALGLAVAGLLSSTFHLGHPERAWRAFSQWKSSWLSREGVLAVLTLVVFGLYALIWLASGERLASLGYLSSFLAALTVFATAMIYAQLKTVPNWHSKLTPLTYLGFALASGFLLAALFISTSRIGGVHVAALAAIFVAAAWLFKFIWWRRADNVGFSETGSNAGTATGLGHLGDVKLLESPHSSDNYLTKEMVHQIGRKHGAKLRFIAVICGVVVPVFLCTLAIFSGLIVLPLLVAVFSMFIGLFCERWLFFAQAKHAVSLFY
jgi:DMSO reductase anchor subunit